MQNPTLPNRRYNTRLALVTAVVLFVSGNVNLAGAQSLLRWKFNVGDECRYEMTSDFSTAVKIRENPDADGDEEADNWTLRIMQKQLYGLVWHVDSVADDGTATMTYSVERIRITESKTNEDNFVYDSQDAKEVPGLPKAAEIAKSCQAIIGQRCVVQITPQGKVLRVSLPAELTAALKNKKLQPIGHFPLDEKFLKGFIERSFFTLAEHPISVGDKWKEKITFGEQASTAEYTLIGPTERNGQSVDKIELITITQLNTPEDVKAEFKERSIFGEAYWDNNAGRMAEVATQTKMRIVANYNNQSTEQTLIAITGLKRAGLEAKAPAATRR